ncbi:MAG TPA: LuxR C-terminal-related transcriptional regulator [Ilumatobacteraceae bacterium]|nr:LuxR C-terminal-related transcriptional regulator [Ilumatobacteraceae bacterium]
MNRDGNLPTQRGMAATKLRPPAPPTRLVQRTRLEQLIDDAIVHRVPLVLVSAPAGSGKSTLLASWAANHDTPLAWLQVEESDSDAARLWSSLVAAIGEVRPDLAAVVAPVVEGSGGDEGVVVPALVNALVDSSDPLVAVIDDYHLIDDASVHRGMERLVELCPPQLTLVVATRVDPPFRLGRLRVRNRISEVRADALRFGGDEATALLGVTKDRLDPALVEQLCARTEGWAAGLVLAGLSLQHAADPARFVEAFRGDDQLVVSYLTDELLDAISAEDRTRLLESSVLERLSGPLVDAVTASSGGTQWLIDIAGRNQLVVRLDNTGTWFRYHHLLRDLLRLEASRSFPERVPQLHARAAEWFEMIGDHGEAVVHRLAAGDVPAAMALMRFVGPDLLGRGQLKTLRTLLDQIGPSAATDTVCSLLWGWYEYLGTRYVSAQHWLETALEMAPPAFDRMIATPLAINVAIGRGDVGTAIAAARHVTDTADLATRPAELATAVGAAFMWAGLPAEARRVLAVAVSRAGIEHRRTANVLALVSAAVNEVEDGDRAAAHAAAETAIATAETFGLARYHGVAPAFAVRARTANDPALARADAQHAVDLARRAATDLGLAYVLTACGDTLLDLGDDDAGRVLLVEARRLIERCVDPGIAGRYLTRAQSRHRVAAPPRQPTRALVEQLTDREMAVLRYMPTQLSLRDISSELYVSMNTVKTHCSAIYRKLGVGDRKAAVQAARELQLL